jgi:isocitrate/isopropylmalate dehydrogenase
MMTEGGIEQLHQHDAILLAAVGLPARAPDSLSPHGLLLPMFRQYVPAATSSSL